MQLGESSGDLKATWGKLTPVGKALPPLFAHGAAYLEWKSSEGANVTGVHVVGGIGDDRNVAANPFVITPITTNLSYTWKELPVSDESGTPQKDPRCYHSLFKSGGQLYVFGGYSNVSGNVTNWSAEPTLLRYNPSGEGFEVRMSCA